jgi:hypothetical protein
MRNTQSILIFAVWACVAAQAAAQGAPYAGQQRRDIKSLSGQEVEELLAGQGMGLAKAAELNGYPGPAHVLENADALGLSAEQRRATEALMRSHKERARALGSEIIEAERALDQAFVNRTVDPTALSKLTSAIGAKQALLREEHLRTHLEQTALLGAGQVRKYAELRGYAGQAGEGAQPAHRRNHH